MTEWKPYTCNFGKKYSIGTPYTVIKNDTAYNNYLRGLASKTKSIAFYLAWLDKQENETK